MPDVSLSMQKAVVGLLKTDPEVSSLVGANIFDTPDTDVYPRVTLGQDQVIAQRADCYVGDELYLTLHAFSREIGLPQVKKIAGAVRLAMDGAGLLLDGHRLVDIAFEDARFMRDPDGTNHAVLTFRALTEPTD